MAVYNTYCQVLFKLIGVICQIQTTAQQDRIDILLVETRLLPCIRVQCCFPVHLMNVIGSIGKVLCQFIGSIVGGGSPPWSKWAWGKVRSGISSACSSTLARAASRLRVWLSSPMIGCG